MRILVTGGSGFIGSALVRLLIQATNCHVLNIDKLTYASHPDALIGISNHPRYQFAKADICDGARLDILFEQFKPNIVMHLAPKLMLIVLLKALRDLSKTIFWGLSLC